jgi:hypothetical protein
VLSSADVLFTSYPWRGLAPGLRPGNDLLTDPAHLFQPWLIYAVSEVWQGRIPLWNPHVFAGSPFFANPQSALLFPLNWVALIVPVAWAFALIAILKVAAIGLATYWFLRVRALHPLAALMGAISFMWSGLVIVWLQWTYATTLIFFPMLFASVECLRIRPGRRAIALVALTVALGVWAGYPQGLALALASASAWALWRAHGAAVSFLLRYAAGVALGLLLASIQLLPFIEYAQLSAVLATREAWMPTMSVSFRSAINLLVPYLRQSDRRRLLGRVELQRDGGLGRPAVAPVPAGPDRPAARRIVPCADGIVAGLRLWPGPRVGKRGLARDQLSPRPARGVPAVRAGRDRNGHAAHRA